MRVRPFLIFASTSSTAEVLALLLVIAEVFVLVFFLYFYIRDESTFLASFRKITELSNSEIAQSGVYRNLFKLPGSNQITTADNPNLRCLLDTSTEFVKAWKAGAAIDFPGRQVALTINSTQDFSACGAAFPSVV